MGLQEKAVQASMALSIFNLVPCPPGEIESGQIFYDGYKPSCKERKRDAANSGKKLHDISGPHVITKLALPLRTNKRVIVYHAKVTKKQAETRALELFDLLNCQTLKIP